MREVAVALRQIDVRVYNDFAIQARWHGHDVPLRLVGSAAPALGSTPDDDALAERAIRLAQDRKRQEFAHG